MICRASFPSSEAKLDPTISLEWYHRGIRRLSNPYKSGGVYITLRWLDSHLLESRLFIAWASEAEAGQWICLERSNPIKKGNLTQMSPNYHKLEYMELNSQSPAYLNKWEAEYAILLFIRILVALQFHQIIRQHGKP
ncbi:unnamed protein product [Trichobilharzia regenti]|nr:unnamed protein product [Trichobilharzia regenti]